MIKLVAMDLDGTLLDGNMSISPRNMEALQKCEAAGVRMVIASGRGFEAARVYARQAGLNSPIICANGARVEETAFGPTMLEDCIPEDISREICEIMFESGIYFVCYARGVNYHGNGTEPQRGRVREPNPDGPAYDVRHVLSPEAMRAEGTKRTYKYVAFTYDFEALAKLRAKIEARGDVHVSSSWENNVEIMAKGASKGRTIRFLAEKYGISKDEIMAFGDQMNDYEMLKEAGWPVAMGNAVDELKACARIVAPHHKDDGVGRVLEEYVLKGMDNAK